MYNISIIVLSIIYKIFKDKDRPQFLTSSIDSYNNNTCLLVYKHLVYRTYIVHYY